MEELIKFEHVSFCYETGKDIFKDLSLSFPSRGLFVILGKSGSGKTTFLSLLTGKLKPTEGRILPSHLNMGIVFQSALLLDYLTVKENILLPVTLKGKEIEEEDFSKTLSMVHLEGLEDRDTKTLSGGEKMRVSIARALIQKSNILVLDEPTGQLDEKNSNEIYQLLKDISKTSLVILVTHDEKNGTRNADFIYHLKDKKFTLLKEGNIKGNASQEKKEEGKGHIRMEKALTISKKYLFRHPFRLALSSFFLAFSLTVLYLGTNLSFHVRPAMSEMLSYYYNYETASLSLKEEVANSGNLKLSKYQVPDENTLHNLNIIEVYPSLDFFLPQYSEINLNKIYQDIRFEPVISENRARLKAGEGIQEKEDIIVNELFLKAFQMNSEDIIGKAISFSYHTLVYSKRYKSSDLINLDYRFRIRGVSKEKNVFSEPIVYYSHNGILTKLEEIHLPNISRENERPVTIKEMLTSKDNLEEDLTSQKILFQSRNPKEEKDRIEKRYPGKVKIESKAITIEESVQEIISSLLKISSAFLGLSLLSAFMLEFISVYSLYDENIRLFALVKTFQENKSNLLYLTFANGMHFFLITVLLELYLSFFFSFLIRFILRKMSYPPFIALFHLKSFLFVILLSLVISIPASLLPLLKIKDSRIKKELEGED